LKKIKNRKSAKKFETSAGFGNLRDSFILPKHTNELEVIHYCRALIP
jgi:hypothetical protein